MRVFITGVAGFLGSHLADAMLRKGHSVVGVDNMIGGEMSNIPTDISFFQADCNDLRRMHTYMAGCELVYHCAATAYEGLSVFSPHLVTQNIVTASTGVFSAAAARGVKRIVHCSSMARYGEQTPPFTELMDCCPQDPYGVGKVCAEEMLKNICETHGIEYVIAVPHNIIGPRQKYDDPYRNVASIMINLMLQGRPPVIYGDGQQQRCFSYVDDCLSCLVQMGLTDKVVGCVVNIGPDEEPITILELAAMLASITGNEQPPVFMPGRPQEVKIALCSSDKARRMLGYRTVTDLKTGLRHMVEAIRERGPRPFKYHLGVEIQSPKCPRTWTDRLF